MSNKAHFEPDPKRELLHEILFESDTPMGRRFNIFLLLTIAASVAVVMLETVEPIDRRFSKLFDVLEWTFTIFFTIEYALRLYAVYTPRRYATSFFGIVDLIAVLPSYITFFLSGPQYLLIVRALRLLRIFRILKLAQFRKESNVLILSLRASRNKIAVFLYTVLILVILIGSTMYVIEGNTNSEAFSSIPRSIYWAIVTLTTVGYGDITPITPIGQFFSAMVMILGYAIIAVPTGIVSAELSRVKANNRNTQTCRFCARVGHDDDAKYCKHCGEILNEPH